MKPTPLPEDPNRALAAEIDQQAPAKRSIKALADALTADQVNRDGSRGPDHRTRVSAALALLQYRVGRPIERSEVISVNLDADAATGLAERLKNSPALRSSLRKMLDQVDAGDSVDT
jgi:hypothetical protein